MQNNRGFTLIEVLASIVILGILATVFFQFFIFSQKTTTGNQEKLIAINVAQGVLERIKMGAYPEITDPAIVNYDAPFNGNVCNNYADSTKKENCIRRYNLMVNNINYQIEVSVDDDIKTQMGILKIEVKVKNDDGKIQSTVKGFVEL